MAWKPEIKVFGDPQWYQNGLVFETEEEAFFSAQALRRRWTLAENYRAVEVDKPINYRFDPEFGDVSLENEVK